MWVVCGPAELIHTFVGNKNIFVFIVHFGDAAVSVFMQSYPMY